MSERDSGEAERVRIELRELGLLQAEVRKNKLGERVEAALNAYHHALPYMVQKKALVEAFEAYEAKLFSEEAIERAAEALWMHRPMERISGGEPKPFRDLKPYQRLRYLGMARAVVAALRGKA